jgi:predicted nucleotidyltransferase
VLLNDLRYNQYGFMMMEIAALRVPPITSRERIPPEAIDSVVQQIIENFNPKKVILFGSYAYGQPRPDSDLDLLIIMKTSLSGVKQAVEISRQIQYRFGLDLLVYTPERLDQRINWGDPFLIEIVSRGKVLYESADA